MKEEQPNKGGRPRKEDFTEKLFEEKDIDTIFSNVPRGYSVIVNREEPEWAAGYLGRHFIDSQTPLNLDTIKQKYGGKVLRIQIQDERGKIKGTKRVTFPNRPLKDGEEMYEDDFSPTRPQNNQMQNVGSHQSSMEMMSSKMIMEMMTSQMETMREMERTRREEEETRRRRQAEDDRRRQEEEDERRRRHLDEERRRREEDEERRRLHAEEERRRREEYEERKRREAEEDRRRAKREKDPLSEMQQTLALFRELNGFKSEFGQSDTVSELVAHAAPIVENSLGQLMSMQKLKLQTELAKFNANKAPALPKRQVAQVPALPESNDSEKLGLQMGELFKNLSQEEQQKALNAFMSTSGLDGNDSDANFSFDDSENMGDDETDSLLDDEDRAILANAENVKDDGCDQSSEIPDSEYTGTVENNNPDNRPSN